MRGGTALNTVAVNPFRRLAALALRLAAPAVFTLRVLVAPVAFRRVILARFGIIAAEQAVQIFGVLEPLVYDHGGIGVG